MGTAVLRSQDCLRDSFRHETLKRNRRPKPHSNPCTNYAAKPNTKTNRNSRRRNRSPARYRSSDVRSEAQSAVVKFPGKNLVMEQVKILKRGEPLGPIMEQTGGNGGRGSEDGAEDLDLMLGSTDRLGPDPETVQKQIRVGDGLRAVVGVGVEVYAGSVGSTSPPPSSLPIPGFLA